MPLTADPAVVRKILQSDPAWCAYALADLTPEYSGSASWHIAANGRPAVLLVYRGFHPPVLFAQGMATELATLLPEVAGEREFYISVKPEFSVALRNTGYQMRSELHLWRMILDRRLFVSKPHSAVKLGLQDHSGLQQLYDDGKAAVESPPFFAAGMLRDGVYYGICEGGAIVAAAGTHVFAPHESVAAIGNVYTRRDCRGRGLGTQVTSAVTEELLQLGIGLVVLNVAKANAAAMRVYARLGFTCYCEYREGIAAARV